MPTLVVGMLWRGDMLAVSLRLLSKHGTHKFPSDWITTLAVKGDLEAQGLDHAVVGFRRLPGRGQVIAHEE